MSNSLPWLLDAADEFLPWNIFKLARQGILFLLWPLYLRLLCSLLFFFTWLTNDRIHHHSVLDLSTANLISVFFLHLLPISTHCLSSMLLIFLGVSPLWTASSDSLVLWLPVVVGQWDEPLGHQKLPEERGNIFFSPISSQLGHSVSDWVTFNYSSCKILLF